MVIDVVVEVATVVLKQIKVVPRAVKVESRKRLINFLKPLKSSAVAAGKAAAKVAASAASGM
ncbi:hypothetical protein MACK_003277 [Theileria orientalis]|uniref:Uncharacterized protein n=1 Tax=Theileria orientalis TaxID=68886 RepID=A0A976SIF4_THEOR|nr:hypothetical protein MACK_003277 [Theileria orientalis]